MIVAVVGSRSLWVENIEKYLPERTTKIISGGAKGVDTCVRLYAQKHDIPFAEIRPDYHRYGRGAPLKRNIDIINQAHSVLAFWDGSSRGTKFVIDYCQKEHVSLTVIRLNVGLGGQ